MTFAAGTALRLAVLLGALLAGAGQARAAGERHWSDGGLNLALTYPLGWKVVPERGAALKLRAADGKGEFEIFSVPGPPAGKPAAQADAALARLHCQGEVRHGSRPVGHLGVRGSVATGLCTGADLGWRLTVTAFGYAGGGVLLRSWLYRAQARDEADLAAIFASLNRAHA